MKRVCIKQNCSKRERGQNKNLAFLYYVAIKRLIVWVSLVFVHTCECCCARSCCSVDSNLCGHSRI